MTNVGQKCRCAVLASMVIIAFVVEAKANAWFVSPFGLAGSPGTFAQPWSMVFALDPPSGTVLAGDTIWLLGGTYKGFYISKLAGTAAKPIIVKPFGGGRVLFDAYTGIVNTGTTLQLDGKFTHYFNLELTNSSPSRISFSINTGSPNDIHQVGGVGIFGEGIKMINCVIHDIPGIGAGFWSTAADAELYGCIFYYNGYQANDRGHGHQVYAQNANLNRPKYITNSFMFTGYASGVQFYASTDKMNGLVLDSNTIFNSAGLSRETNGKRLNLLVGGENGAENPRARNIVIRHNVFYRDTTDNSLLKNRPYATVRKNVELGYSDETIIDSNILFTHNHLYGDPTPLHLHTWETGLFSNNYLYAWNNYSAGEKQLIYFNSAGIKPIKSWDQNQYFSRFAGGSSQVPFGGRSFNNWKADFGIDHNSTHIIGEPNENFHFVRRNRYTPEKVYITVLNHLRNSIENINLADIPYPAGTRYELFDVQNSLHEPVSTGFYNGASIALDMNRIAVASPVALGDVPPKHSSNALATYIITFYPEVHSIKAGSWHDASVWSTGKVPDEYSSILVKHTVTLYKSAWCRSLVVESPAELNITPQQKLFILGTALQ